MALHVHNVTHSSRENGIQIDSWSRDPTWSSIIAHVIPGLRLHFYLSTPLPEIVFFCSPLHDFYVLMDSSVSVFNFLVNLNWWTTYLDFMAKDCQGWCFRDTFGIWKLKIGKDGSFGEM